MKYAMSKIVDLSYDAAIAKVTEELRKEGFGILTRIDVKETLKEKLGIDFKRYAILGACNPGFARSALEVEDEIGLLLPCNVIVYESEGKTRVSIFDPMLMPNVIENEKITPIASEVRKHLERVLASV
ncbi:MAG: DUF302 domain-containing protein [Spirochaetia bacterium]|nr:DUF302 domain-containing protein [Spirochaetia bacterium]